LFGKNDNYFQDVLRLFDNELKEIESELRLIFIDALNAIPIVRRDNNIRTRVRDQLLSIFDRTFADNLVKFYYQFFKDLESSNKEPDLYKGPESIFPNEKFSNYLLEWNREYTRYGRVDYGRCPKWRCKC